MQKLIFAGLVLFPTFVCASFQRKAEGQMSLEKVIEIQEAARIPGLQVEVREGGQTLFSEVSGVRALGFEAPVSKSDRWHLGSCTKPMTAVLIGRLVDRGLLQWTTPLREIFPPGKDLHPSVRPITVEQLLGHTSGLVDVTAPEDGTLWSTLFVDPAKTPELRPRLIKGILSESVQFQPGSKLEYSNSGYVVLGRIAEIKLRKSWEKAGRKLFKMKCLILWG